MKSIYILLTRSTTICSRIVYMATRSEFTHAAISLDRNFDKLYTFGRKYKRLMLPAGFVRESVYDGLLGDSDDMRCAVYEIKISDISYKRLTKFLSHMEKNKEKYRYSILGLPMCKFNRKYERKGYFFCSGHNASYRTFPTEKVSPALRRRRLSRDGYPGASEKR